MGGRGAKMPGGKREDKKQFVYVRDASLREWSETEEKHAVDMTKKIGHYIYDLSEFYEEQWDEEPLYYETLSGNGFSDEEFAVYKSRVVYSGKWDENDELVKQGKAISGTTYYVATSENSGDVDESHFAYKTKEEAIHALKLFVDREKQFRDYTYGKK